MIFKEKVSVYSDIHMKQINTICGQDLELFFNIKAGGTYSNRCSLIFDLAISFLKINID
jgi:hypothetical protein